MSPITQKYVFNKNLTPAVTLFLRSINVSFFLLARKNNKSKRVMHLDRFIHDVLIFFGRK